MESLRSRLPQRLRRALVGIVGGVVLLAGIVMIPYPGPGWVVVFIGLAILAQEFTWARRALHRVRAIYDRWEVWVKQQSWLVRVGLFISTCVVVIVTIWLINGYGLINTWLHLGQGWLNSPFVR